MQLTYNQALSSVIEYTEMGYTIASQDRLWTVFIFDTWSDGDERSLRYNRLFSRGIGKGWCYDIDIDGLMWTSRHEAEAFAEKLREHLAQSWTEADGEAPEVFVMNWGDDTRYEATLLGRYGARPRSIPKYKGSGRAWEAMIEMGKRWIEFNTQPDGTLV